MTTEPEQQTIPQEQSSYLQLKLTPNQLIRQRETGAITPWSIHRIVGTSATVSRLTLQYKLHGHRGCVNTVHFDPTGELLLSGSDDCNVVIWDWANREKRLTYDSGHTGNVFQARVIPNTNNRTIITCAADGQVRVGNLNEGGTYVSHSVAQHGTRAHKLAIDPYSPHVFLSCGEDSNVCQFDLREKNPNDKDHTLIYCLGDNEKPIGLNSIALNPLQPELLVLGCGDEYARVYDRRMISQDQGRYATGKGACQKFTPPDLLSKKKNEAKRPRYKMLSITCAVYSYNGSEILATYNDDLVYLFDARRPDDDHFLMQYEGHRNMRTVKGVNFFGPRSEFVVSGSDCGHVFLWEKDTGRLVNMMKGDKHVVNCLEPHPRQPVLATSGIEHDIKIWAPTAEKPFDIATAKEVMELNKRKREEDEPPSFLREEMLTNLLRLYRAQQADSDEEEEEGSQPQFVCRQS
eukprot:TRINITY_DN2831_c0_g1_i1.p1 TRINITY_DN2831_c0_g1~~TRINITY_DN2831_c0_g1_i1.p1  ORF type:complete len:462 (-),score=70.58 TRINITY_DN2831_c0_g1_i1:959-2344(-)